MLPQTPALDVPYPSDVDESRSRSFSTTADDARHPGFSSAEQLRQLATQIQSFLSRQIDRLEQELASCTPASEEQVELEHLLAEFRQEREAWEHEKLQEQKRLREDSQRLIEAWQRLEAEQRELLKQRALKKNSASNTVPAVPATLPVINAVPAEVTVAGTVAGPGSTAGGAAPSVAHRNQQQFQQLRREMLEHARQRRKR